MDPASVHRLVEHHVQLGVTGLMLAGTCGEGPWLTDEAREALIRTVVEANRGRLRIAVQVTDNSPARTLAHAERAAAWGAQIAVVAQPYFMLNATPDRQLGFYREIARGSALPVGFYDRGKNNARRWCTMSLCGNRDKVARYRLRHGAGTREPDV